ncbi:MAG: alpha/beta fold hydrolase [bacterium]
MKTKINSLRWILVAFAITLVVSGFGQDALLVNKLKGSWAGAIKFRGVELPMVMNVSSNAADSLTITFDSPTQGAKGIPTSAYSFKGDSAFIELKSLVSLFSGKVSADTISGVWKQSGFSLPIKLARQEKKFELIRPQEPKPPFPYDNLDVSFKNEKAGVTLAGTLTTPKAGGPFPAVILITGSGPQNRDEELLGHKPFLVIADWLTRQGIAVLRYDDRGVGKSGGDFSSATSYDFAADAEAALDFLKKRAEIDSSRIGFIGHSEGGMIAPLIVSQRSDVAFIVLMAGPGITGEQILYLQGELIAKAAGEKEKDIKDNLKLSKDIYSLLKKTSDNDKAAARIRELMSSYDKKHAADSGYQPLNETQLAGQIKTLTSPWFRCFLTFDPVDYLSKVKCPVLAINGTLDLQVPCQENLQTIEKALIFGGNSSYEIKEFEGLNHLFQHAKTGGPDEYSKIEETIAPDVLEIISAWILATVK